MGSVTPELRDAVEQFLYLEADLMDRQRYDDWFALWCDELTYWAPCNDEVFAPSRHVSLFYDDRERLEERVFRLKSKQNHSQSPPSRLSRVVANVRVTEGTSPDVVEVESRFTLLESRLDQLNSLAGRVKHVLERSADGFRIREKHVFLVTNDAVMSNLTFLV